MSHSLSISIIYDWNCPLSEFSFFDVNSGKSYFPSNESDLFLAAYNSGMDRQLKEIVDSKKPVSIYFSGPFMEQLALHDSDIISAIKANKHIELLGGTYHHSLVSLFSKKHFQKEVDWHKKLSKKCFGKKAHSFLNTNNVYFNDLAEQLANAGYHSTFTGAIDWHLGDKKDQRVFSSRNSENFKLMLTNSNSEAILFQNTKIENHFIQFSSQQLEAVGGWNELLRKTKNKADLVTLQEQLKGASSDTYNIRQPISCSYGDLNLNQLQDYPLQQSWLKQLYGLESSLSKKPEVLQKKWSRLGSIGVLKSLNPDLDRNNDQNSYDVYQSLINIISDLHLKL